MGKKENLIVGLDIGTTKICAIVGEITDDWIDIIGIGSHPSKGLKKGVVINIESTVESIKRAVEEAELMAGCDISAVFAGIAGGHIRSFNSHGVIAIKDKEIVEADVERVVDAAKAVAIPMDREVIHILPQEFIIDDQGGIRDPLGMSGVRLEAKVHIITAAVASAQNIIKCAHRAGLNVADIILDQLASAQAVLTLDERELGVALIDLGGGTTDIAVFSDGSVRHTAVLSMGGDHITNDIAVGLRTPTVEAEKIKIKYGCAMPSMVGKDETIEVPGVGGRKAKTEARRFLGEIIEPRVEEILELARREVIKAGFDNRIVSGVVLTGGTALMEGVMELSENVFELPSRKGIPKGIGGLVDVVNNPMYSTGVGLVLQGARGAGRSRFRIRENDIFQNVKNRMKEWFKGIKNYF